MRSFFSTSLLLIFILLISNSLTAQIWLDDASIYDEAEEYIQGEEYEEALALYMLLEKKGKGSSNISYKIGKCFLNIVGKKTRAIPYLEAAVENISSNYVSSFSEVNAPSDAQLLLGVAYRIDGQFDNAIAEFNKYKELNKDTDSKTLADYHISLCKTAQTLVSFPNKSTLEVVNAEGDFPLYNPIVTQQGVSYYMEKRPFYDAIIKAEHSDGALLNQINISPQIKTDGDHIIVNSNKEGNVILLRAYDAEYGYELYFAKLDEQGKWSKYEKFPEPINTPQNEVFASFASNMKTLYFCSNRTGGFGGTDIYKSEIDEKGNWSEPVNLGSKVNTAFNESSVFLAADGQKLFFSSEGHLNMGGSDYFFASKTSDGEWDLPVNLGSPVSTPDDDVFLSPTQADNIFYTYRFDNEKNDKQKIYKVTLDEAAYARKAILKGQLEFNENVPAKEVLYKILENETTISTSKTNNEGAFTCMLPVGNYNINYMYSELISASQNVVIKEDFEIDELNIEAPEWTIITPDVHESLLVTIKPVLFEFNSTEIPKIYYSYLDSIYGILTAHKDIKINIVGHTDAIGNSLYNQKLSERRAMAVKQYFVNKGLNSLRVFAKGMGEKEPAAINENPDGSDNKEGRKYNRRVKINLIVSETSIDIKIIDEVPEELKLQ